MELPNPHVQAPPPPVTPGPVAPRVAAVMGGGAPPLALATHPAAPLVLRAWGLGRALAVGLLLGLIATGIWVALRGDLSSDTLLARHAELEAWRDAQGGMAMLGFFGVTALAALISLPGIAVFTLAGGVLFGALWATVLTAGAATLGAIGLFLLARAGFGGGLLDRLEGGRAGWLADELRRNQIKTLLLLRVAPVVPFVMANTLPALMGVRLLPYVATTFVGLIPGTAAVAFAGHGLAEVAATGREPDLVLVSALVIGVPTAFLVLALAARLMRR